jgi:hypothetical protein
VVLQQLVDLVDLYPDIKEFETVVSQFENAWANKRSLLRVRRANKRDKQRTSDHQGYPLVN